VRLMVLRLSELLRTTLVPQEIDLEFVRGYLDLEKMRLNGRLGLRWKIESGTGEVLVPQLILQPLVENAILDGVSCSREVGWVEIGARRTGNSIELRIGNSVGGKSPGGMGVGSKNTEARLKFLYAEEHQFSFEVDKNRAATAKLVFPAM
jgi:two-component system, LytTR family, sensor kinase